MTPVVMPLLLAAAAAVQIPEVSPSEPFAKAGAAAAPAVTPRLREPQLTSLDDIPSWKYLKVMLPSPEAERKLAADGLVVDRGHCYREMFEIYEQNRYRPVELEEHEDPREEVIHRTFLQGMPSVVTPDVVLHNLHLFFDHVLAQAEERAFLPALEQLLGRLVAALQAELPVVAGTELDAPARDALAFVAVGAALCKSGTLVTSAEAREMDGTQALTDQLARRARAREDFLLPVGLPPDTAARAKEELDRVLSAQGRAAPSILAYPGEQKEDYTQYVVRGHYRKTPRLQGYFRAMMWCARIQFSFGSPQAVSAATMLTVALGREPEVMPLWERIDEACSFLFGRADDASLRQWLPAFTSVYGRSPSLSDLRDAGRRRQLEALLARLPSPAIQGVVTRTEHGPALASTRALHLFPQRRVADAVIFQSLVDPKVPSRGMVSALEVPEVLGSAAAAAILAPRKLMNDPAYAAAHAAVAREAAAMIDRGRLEDADAAWLHTLRALWTPLPAGMPRFMRSDAYGKLRLNAAMASYAELKHDTVLYAKQAAAEMGGPDFEDTEVGIDDRGYVVPEIETYARAADLLERLRRGLEARRLFPGAIAGSYDRFQALVGSLVAISAKELEERPLDAKELDLVKFIGGDLEHFWHDTLIAGQVEEKDMLRGQLLDQNNAQLVADVFTGPKAILHVATGYVHPVFVVFAREGKLHIGRGAAASYYEIESPERLDDGTWRERLASDAPPAPPEWTDAFSAKAPDGRCDVYWNEGD